MVSMLLHPEFSLTERMAVEALRGGYATAANFNELIDVRDMLLLGADARGDKGALAVADAASEALLSIRERKLRTGRVGASGDELATLAALVDLSEDFWKRQSGDLFDQAHKALCEYRTEQAALAAQEAA